MSEDKGTRAISIFIGVLLCMALMQTTSAAWNTPNWSIPNWDPTNWNATSGNNTTSWNTTTENTTTWNSTNGSTLPSDLLNISVPSFNSINLSIPRNGK